MTDIPFRFGAEVYTWFMDGNGKAHQGELGHMIEVTARAGFDSIEPIAGWMGELSDPDKLAAKLNEHGIELAAIALTLPWNNPEETEEEIKKADEIIELTSKFPGAMLCLVHAPAGRHDVAARRKNLVANLNSVARRAAEKGVESTFHPNSPSSSITRTEEDYDVILPGLDPEVIGWTPDVGHIINGEMDPLAKMKEYESLINLVHYKDWQAPHEFALMGEGKVDLVGITQWLKDIGYDGWIICEDEAPRAVDHPDEVTLHDGQWIKNDLLPALT
ncbi:sugar phosphate isomerase/epimerase [Aliifodinibius sp. S!AR15-10]|uniref:sugar phosphate isomerase/epimerase family protein n=1 Tax=Aliifodinibius sp. S!AR15-10 TaxID=2950437 RepID=UPI002866E9AE|nr:sugar phosphate isomerase/epimerase family protein [Aliifodinibius sp. S!AR15-10]MDR8394632.1 sugar phosphate isomerase/epimerase [Aliifodinibius sp. S!AR15-10]